MRVALVAESFHPTVNGVSNSVLRVARHLRAAGHHPLVVAPGPGPERVADLPVVRVRSVRLPLDRGVPVGLPRGGLAPLLSAFDPDLVHLASPTVLGWYGARAAADLQVPTVAVYQTDLAGFARHHHLGGFAPLLRAWQRRVHDGAAVTLAPSSWATWQLRAAGVRRVALWPRGVDLTTFSPRRRCPVLHRDLAPRGELVVGYVGRLAREKQVHLLARLAGLPGVRLVVVGDGPCRRQLERRLPTATFRGLLHGAELATAMASLDLFVHTGIDETFGQAVQEALACGVPVLAPARGGPLDLVRHGENGWLWPPTEPELLRTQVSAALEDRKSLADMRVRARASVLGRSWETVNGALVAHYRRVVEAHPEPYAGAA